MAIFQKSVINEYLLTLDQNQVDEAYKRFVKSYNSEKIAEIKTLKEEEYQDGFLRDIFVNVLGYTLKPDEGHNLEREFKNQTDSKKADGAIIKDKKAIVVIELKSTKTRDLKNVTQQAFNYKNNQPECKYVITSNFHKLRFYIDHANEFEEFDLFNLNREEFDLFYLILNKDNIFTDIPLALKTKTKFHDQKVSGELYKDYSSFKRNLFENLVKNNPEADKLTLFIKSQKLLDRFLFILFAEDSGLLSPNSISHIVKDFRLLKKLDRYEPIYETFKAYFGYINSGRKGENSPVDDIPAYNGGLFYADELLDNLKINDDILIDDLLKLSKYDFNTDVDVNILGHIFEHSLSEIEEITAEIEGTAPDKSKSKRKKDGVFYTPKYITTYIVENTVGTLCDEKRKELGIGEIEFDEAYRTKADKLTVKGKKLYQQFMDYKNWLISLKIVDPACGSGAFLNQALNYLIQEHKDIDGFIAELTGTSLPIFDIDKTILENNLYGVDINEESIEIAKLSLWLRTAQKGRKLSNLNGNIKCGNSLISDKEVAGDKAFDWNIEFKDIMDDGGFDAVIGNPPYVDIKGLDSETVKYLFQYFESANNRVNLYSSFIEKSLSLLNNNKYLSFIIPSSLLTQESYKQLRKTLLDKTTIKHIVRLPNESFGGGVGEVKVDTIILTFKLGVFKSVKTEVIVYKGFKRIDDISTYNADINFMTNSFDWKSDENAIFKINVDDRTIQIINKCQIKTKKLVDCAEFCLGFTPYDKYKGHSQEQIKSKAFHADHKKDDSYRVLLAGGDVKRYNVEWGGLEWISYGDWLGAPRERRFFTSKRILIKQIIDWSDKRIWSALTEKELYNTQNAFNLIPKDGYEAEFLIALINSSLISFYHRKNFLDEFKDRFQKILIKDAKKLPIKDISIEDQQIYIDKVRGITLQTSLLRGLVAKFTRYYSGQLLLNKLSRKLESWQELDFGEFIKEINKSIKKSGRVELTKIDEMEWMDVFETKKSEVQALKAEINETDAEIDQMVYNLYELTNEEIAIVENSIN
jgi:type I restriction-modification system DNA methylase subunit